MPVALKEEVSVPEGVEFRLDGSTVEMTGPKGKLKRKFEFAGLDIRADGRKIVVEADSQKRKSKAAVGTVKAHLRNMLRGVKEGFVYKMRVVYSHFPITVKVEGRTVLINNFLGEHHPRSAEIVEGTAVEVSGDEILVRGVNRDDVGQTAVNIERATSVKYRDRRVFQDGCYIADKG